MDDSIPVTISNELEQWIADTFSIFDFRGDKCVDSSDVGTILRFLGCVPTEEDISKIVKDTEFEDWKGAIHLSKFLPYVVELLIEKKMKPVEAQDLLEAFQAFDPDGHGFISKERMSKFLTEDGEPFNQEELDRMMNTAVDPETQTIPYEYYINQLLIKPSNSIYDLAEIIGMKMRQLEQQAESERKSMKRARLSKKYAKA